MNEPENLMAMRIIAGALSDLSTRVVYVGGAVVRMYSNDPTAIDEQETRVTDLRIEIASLWELEKTRKSLLEKGFTLSEANKVRCQFHYEGIIVDVISTEDTGWAEGNSWFKKGFVFLEQRKIDESKLIVPPLAYFLAMKFSAYHERATEDPGTSHDLEDIAYVLNNRNNLSDELENYPDDVQQFLKEEFKSIIKNKLLQEALRGYLPLPQQAKRFKLLMAKLRKVVSAAKETK